jgi:small subunit ribosomal protein S18
MPEPKTVERRIAFRKANKAMPRRRIDLQIEKVDYKSTEILSKFTSETGKILPRRVTGVSAKLHRRITREIKRARVCNLLP